MPTIEEMLWRAFMKGYLIQPEGGSRTRNGEGEVTWEGCEYSKCGRTDRGVSAFGQVIGIRLRSNGAPDVSSSAGEYQEKDLSGLKMDTAGGIGLGNEEIQSHSVLNEDLLPSSSSSQEPNQIELCPVEDEIPYIQILNRLLPPEIRVLAWCPSPPPGFNARFSCKERRYKYFFTQPAFAPTRGASGFKRPTSIADDVDPRREGWLNIEAMREAAKKFEGVHDFRNFCRVDASKQIQSFERRIFHADIEELPPNAGPAGYINLPGFQERKCQISNGFPNDAGAGTNSSIPKIYTFNLHGSGFLWHQVRCMVAILFRIGQGLESPNLVDALLDIQRTPEKPMYDMAEDAPLVLWDCIFPRQGGNPHEDALEWVYAGDHLNDNNSKTNSDQKRIGGKHGPADVVDDLWKLWRGRKVDEVLAGRLLDVVAAQSNPSPPPPPPPHPLPTAEPEDPIDSTKNNNNKNNNAEPWRRDSQKVFLGGDAARAAGKYIPVLEKPRRERIEVLNAKYAARKGFEQNLRVRERGFRSVVLGGGRGGGREGEGEMEGERERQGEEGEERKGEEVGEKEEENIPPHSVREL